MGNFRNGNRSFGGGSSRSGGRSFGGRSSGGGSRGGFGGRGEGRGGFSRGPVEMHDAICSKCKNECQVPFRPTGSKPVFCSSCFEKSGDSRGSRDSRDSGSRFESRNEIRPVQRPMNENQPNELKQINAKLDKIIAILQELELDSDEEDDSTDDLTDDLDSKPEDVLVDGVEKDLSEDEDSEDDEELGDDEEIA